MKLCTNCKINKELADFAKGKGYRDGHKNHCKTCCTNYHKTYRKLNPLTEQEKDAKKEKARKWFLNKELSTEEKEEKSRYSSEWAKNNRHIKNADQAKYKTLKKNQTPELTNEEKIKLIKFYKEAITITKLTGVPHEVDHIIPINRGGLHHPDNLQILTRKENRSKKDKILI